MRFKKIGTVCLILLIAMSSLSATYADDAGTTAGLPFTGPTINLSLDQALSIALTSGASIKAAEVQKLSDAANAKANAESASNMNKVNKDATSSDTYSASELDRVRKENEYYTSMADRNYAAAQNTITYNINNAYYALLNTEKGVETAKENEQLQKNLLALVNQKLSLGIASKLDVLEAEINLNNAESSLYSAEVSLAEKKIALNIELGYDEMQDVNPTSTLEMVNMSVLAVDQAVSNALANRNELYTCAFNIYSAEKALDNYKAYPKNSSKYLNAYSSLVSAQNNYDNKEALIEKEVLINYSAVLSAKISAENSKLSADKAKEYYDIYLTKYKLGMATLDDVQQAQISYADAEKSYSDAILAFNLAVITYEMSATVGMSSN